jgi:hypothetical protein
MVEYICKKCGKGFHKKTGYTRHIQRKNPCDSTVLPCNGCGRTFRTKYEYDRHMGKKKSCMLQIGSHEGDTHTCKYCDGEFSSYKSLHTHIANNTCDKTINVGTYNDKAITNTLNQNLNVGGDVKVVKFGSENLSYISDDLFKQILGRGFRSVSEFIGHSHFDPNHPENHNIYIANIKEDYVVIYDGDKWTINKRDEVVENIIYTKSDFLFNKFRELRSEMRQIDIDKFMRFMSERDEDRTMNILKEEIKLQLYNNRYTPQKTRRHMEYIERMNEKDFLNTAVKNRSENVLNNIVEILNSMDEDKLKKMQSVLNGMNINDIRGISDISDISDMSNIGDTQKLKLTFL